ncbi:MAG: hypothetical protein Q8P99_00705, partial [bacterium]|nr:hypothetical protein [bacterium]
MGILQYCLEAVRYAKIYSNKISVVMFSKRKEFSQHYKFNREFLEKLVSDLKQTGFSSVTVKLPHNLLRDDKDEITIDEFLNRERNYPSIILIGRNEGQQETIKVLFINISTKAFFKDDTFPSGHSEPPELYVQSPDPARVHALFGFFYDYLKSNSLTKAFSLWFLFLISFLFFILETFYLLNGKFLLSQTFNTSPLVDFTGMLLAIFFIFKFFSYDGGLHVKEKEDKHLSAIR